MVLVRKRFRTAIAAVGVILLLMGLLAVPTWAQGTTNGDGPEPVVPGPDDECPGAEVAASVGPATNDRRQAFDVTGQSFRVTYQVQFTVGEDRFRDFSVEIEDEFGLVEPDSTDQSGTRSFTVPEGSDSFEVVTDVTPNRGAEYTVIVEDCVGENQTPSPGNDTSEEDQYDNNDGDDNVDVNDDVDDDNVINIPQKALPNTGGPPLLAIGFSLVAGAGLLTAVVRRRS